VRYYLKYQVPFAKEPIKLRFFFTRDLPRRATHMEWQRVTYFEHFLCKGSFARKKNAIDPWNMDAFIQAHPYKRVHTHTRTCTRTRSRTRACEHEVTASCAFSLKGLNSRHKALSLYAAYRESKCGELFCVCVCVSLSFTLSH